MSEMEKEGCTVESYREENRSEEVSKRLSNIFNSPLMPEESATTTVILFLVELY